MTRYSTHRRSRGHVANHERVPSGGSLTYGLALTAVLSMGVAWAQDDAADASEREAAGSSAQTDSPTTNPPSAPQAVVSVKMRSDTDPGGFDISLGAVVPSVGDSEPNGWVVIPVNETWLTNEQHRKLGDDKEKTRVLFRRKFDGARVDGPEWSGTATYVDWQPFLGLILLQLGEANRDRPAFILHDSPKADGMRVFVHHGTEQHPGRLTVEYASDANPWWVVLDDGGPAVTGAPITTLNGKLIGIARDLKSSTSGELPAEQQRTAAVVIPAEYADAIVRIQHPGVNDELDTLVIGMAMGKERAQVEGLRGDGVAAAAAGGQPDAVNWAGATESDEPGYGYSRRATGGAAEPQPQPEVRTFHPQHVDPTELQIALQNVLGLGVATFSSVPTQRNLIVQAQPEILQTVESLIAALDTDRRDSQEGDAAQDDGSSDETSEQSDVQSIPAPSPAGPAYAAFAGGGFYGQTLPQGEFRVFRLRHLSANEASAAMQPHFLGPGNVVNPAVHPTFAPVKSQQALIVRGQPDALKRVEALIRTLDVPRVQTESEDGTSLPEAGAPIGLPGPPHLPRTSVAGEEAVGARRLPPNFIQRRFDLQHVSPRNLIAILEGVRQRPDAEWLEMDFNVDQDWINVRGSAETLRTVEQLIAALDTRHAGSVLRRPRRAVINVAPSNRTIGSLRDAYAEHDIRARQQAATFQKLAESGDQHDAQKLQHVELSKAVAEAFDARQNLQRAELDALAAKVASMRRMLQARERIKEQIIQRRVEELLNPALEWETSGDPKKQAAGQGDARVTVKSDWPVPFTHTLAPGESAPTQPFVAELLYQGRTESEWQRLFTAETEPVAKLEAAVALLNLAASLPPEQRVERILEIGEEIVNSPNSEDALPRSVAQTPPQLWDMYGGGKNDSAYARFGADLYRIIQATDGTTLARRLTSAIVKGSDLRAAFAYSMLCGPAMLPIAKAEDSGQFVLNGLRKPVTGLDRSVLCLLARIRYSKAATNEQLADLTDQLNELIGLLLHRPSGTDEFSDAIVRWLTFSDGSSGASFLGQFDDPRVARGLAELTLNEIVDRGEKRFFRSPFVVNESFSAYDQRVLDQQRRYHRPAPGGWVPVANRYLAEHNAPPYSEADKVVFNGLCQSIAFYSDGDDWPVDRTAEILTEQLRAAYTDHPAQTVDQPVSELLPASTATMLAQIVAITGDIPEFVKTGSPKSSATAQKLATLDALLQGNDSESVVNRKRTGLVGLLDEAPYETVRRVIVDARSADRPRSIRVGGMKVDSALHMLHKEAQWFHGSSNPHQEAMRPLLLLFIVADLTGCNDIGDERISELLGMEMGSAGFGIHIRNLLASRLQSRRHAKRMLREMAAKTESPELLDMIKSIDPEAVGPVAEGGAEPISNEKD